MPPLVSQFLRVGLILACAPCLILLAVLLLLALGLQWLFWIPSPRRFR